MCKDNIYILQNEINKRASVEKDFTKGEILNLSRKLDKLINEYYLKMMNR